MNLSEDQVRKIKQAVGHKGRKPARLLEFRPGMNLNSYWDGGCRDYFFYVSLNNFHATPVPQNGTPFDRLNLSTTDLEPNHVLVESSIFRGKQLPLKIYSK